jgi:hypothetical protein
MHIISRLLSRRMPLGISVECAIVTPTPVDTPMSIVQQWQAQPALCLSETKLLKRKVASARCSVVVGQAGDRNALQLLGVLRDIAGF